MNSPNKRFLAGSEVGRRLAVFLDPRAHHKDAVALSRHHTRQGERPRRGPALHHAVCRVLTWVRVRARVRARVTVTVRVRARVRVRVRDRVRDRVREA